MNKEENIMKKKIGIIGLITVLISTVVYFLKTWRISFSDETKHLSIKKRKQYLTPKAEIH